MHYIYRKGKIYIFKNFLIPLKRSLSNTKEVSRGAGLGLSMAMTPTVGLQIPLALVVWLFIVKVCRIKTDLVNTLAWTWVNNPFTAIPIYSFLYWIGSKILGEESQPSASEEEITNLSQGLIKSYDESGIMEFFSSMNIAGLLDSVLLPMLIGSLVCMPPGYFIGYFLGGKVAKFFQIRRQKRKKRRQTMTPLRT